ncbi:endolytic transglycosylase MltG [Psychromonas sp. CD1]|uniref:endolytic transglycosylase MltG n=1 Tax=Psychromonas sp. CD1 TaxID=1979839 RepID=UPI000B9B1E42|nr:endolytic transglycosylase MltG [Psychromonas sp. CD1]
MFLKKTYITISIVIILTLGTLTYIEAQMKDYLNIPLIDKTQLFVVESGSNFSLLGKQLFADGIVAHLGWWHLLAKRYPDLTAIKSGTYELREGSNLLDILTVISKGKEYQYKITFVEGSTYKDWLLILEKQSALLSLQKTETEIIKALNIPHEKLEGLLFPETYHYNANTSAYKIIKKAYFHQKGILAKLWKARAKDLPYKNSYDALIIASIIEKESGSSADRNKIASVFVNRLRLGMRLQTDPTVIYGMGDRYKGHLYRKNLQEKTIYNTYIIKGLPPTPIAMPSEAALYAALQPAETKYLYFVSKGDGTSYFSENLKEHERAVRKYILGK